ncbi:hypothetical protein PsYK624_002320 [Phanerochaete sordida]|uniref:Uncharacterized protein n=1 Tax=Phanerochaete sordida TaxID=48140 RepID=A0A9P3FX06_9APHY|nr:hypothetical protein PsYK624_002320 [Phanerochaete sordida]
MHTGVSQSPYEELYHHTVEEIGSVNLTNAHNVHSRNVHSRKRREHMNRALIKRHWHGRRGLDAELPPLVGPAVSGCSPAARDALEFAP